MRSKSWRPIIADAVAQERRGWLEGSNKSLPFGENHERIMKMTVIFT